MGQVALVTHCYRARTKWELDAIPGQWVVTEAEDHANPSYVWARLIAGHSRANASQSSGEVDQGRGWIHYGHLHIVSSVQHRRRPEEQQQQQQQSDDTLETDAALTQEVNGIIRGYYRRIISADAVSMLSNVPLLVRCEGFLDSSSCRVLIDAAEAQGFSLDKAGVVGSEHLSARTSEGQWLYPHSPQPSNPGGDRNRTRMTVELGGGRGINGDDAPLNSVIRMIESKVAALSRQPSSHQEPLHLVRYKPGQEYRAHVDAVDEHEKESHGHRLSTVLIYLNDVADGGSTSFTDLNLEVKPATGAAIFWHNVCPSKLSKGSSRSSSSAQAAAHPLQRGASSETSHLQPDHRLTHAARSIPSGEKFVAIKWVHAFPFVAA